MLIRPDGEASILIAQPAHAWVSGQLARAWKQDAERPLHPFEEICLAAEQHDIGWLTWEASPTLNPETGLPYSFREMPRREQIQIWTRARRFAMTMNCYAALLISRHGTGLFERYGPREDAPQAEKDQIAGFLRRERDAQQRLIEQLADSPRYADYLDDATLERYSDLIRTWDGISLMICSGLSVDGVTFGGYSLVPDPDQTSIRVDPWPFAEEQVTLVVEGRRLEGRYDRPLALQAGLRRAKWETLEFDLVPDS